MIEQAKFTYSPLGKLLENKQKRLKSKEKTIDATTNQNIRLEPLANEDDHRSIYTYIFDKLVSPFMYNVVKWSNTL